MWLLTCHAAHGRDCDSFGAIEQGIVDSAPIVNWDSLGPGIGEK